MAEAPPPDLTIARVDAQRIRPLRHAVLRAGLPPESAHFPGDEAATSMHLAALGGGRVIGCMSLMASDLFGQSALQLRGMATDPAHRRHGVGKALLREAERLRAQDPVRLWWCNARVGALAFYLALGWIVISDEYEIPTAGPHRRMLRLI